MTVVSIVFGIILLAAGILEWFGVTDQNIMDTWSEHFWWLRDVHLASRLLLFGAVGWLNWHLLWGQSGWYSWDRDGAAIAIFVILGWATYRYTL